LGPAEPEKSCDASDTVACHKRAKRLVLGKSMGRLREGLSLHACAGALS
jgi:hypothetical protein